MKSNTLQMPGKIVIEENQPTYGVFSWEPLEKGAAYSLGNALRRAMLSYSQGVAITHLKFPENVLHEFDAIQGVGEDMTDIILNLKQLRFKKKMDNPEDKIVVKVKNQSTLTGSDIQAATSSFEVLNPDFVICHIDDNAQFEMELTLQEGRGYSLADDHKPKEQKFGEVSIDAIFSPVLNVEIRREDALVGTKTDYEKLIIKVSTNGTKSPEECLRESAAILREHFALLSTEEVVSVSEGSRRTETIDQEIENFRNLLQTPVEKLDLSPRVLNSLNAHDIRDLGHVVSLKISDYMKWRNFGKKSLEELQTVLKNLNLTFGMDIKGYRRNRD